jgi:hypothetical protein
MLGCQQTVVGQDRLERQSAETGAGLLKHVSAGQHRSYST